MQRVFRYAFLLGSGAAYGAVRNNIAPSHGHDIWDAGAGFPGGYLNSMTQTADAHIWLGTSKSLVKYDALTFVSSATLLAASRARCQFVRRRRLRGVWTHGRPAEHRGGWRSRLIVITPGSITQTGVQQFREVRRIQMLRLAQSWSSPTTDRRAIR